LLQWFEVWLNLRRPTPHTIDPAWKARMKKACPTQVGQAWIAAVPALT